VILHEEAEDGNAMPDLERPVMAVSRAVTNLVKVRKYSHYGHIMYRMTLFTLKSVYQNIHFLEGLSLVKPVVYVPCGQFGAYLWELTLYPVNLECKNV
jgi:hypothetical protein